MGVSVGCLSVEVVNAAMMMMTECWCKVSEELRM